MEISSKLNRTNAGNSLSKIGFNVLPLPSASALRLRPPATFRLFRPRSIGISFSARYFRVIVRKNYSCGMVNIISDK